jgi:hypothetical protein
MKPIPLAIGAILLGLVGSMGILGLAIPTLREGLAPQWAVAASSLTLMITGAGLWCKRKWTLIFFLLCWGAQAISMLALGIPARWGSGVVGLALVSGLSAAYWQQFEW